MDLLGKRTLMRHLAVVAILLAFGFARVGWEQSLLEEHRAAYFHGAKLDLELREQVGQFGFVAALSGFRSLVADLLWIRAHSAWEETEWGRMYLIFNQVVALQPRTLMFWDMAAWHMAWNASVAAERDGRIPRETLRIKAAKDYIHLGEDFLVRGIANNPDRHLLYERLGFLYQEKLKDPFGASREYEKASRFPTAPAHLKRFAAYQLAKCPGHEREAYGRLRSLYDLGESERLPTLITLLGELEEKLGIPGAERISIPTGDHGNR
jgi:hypothetical protein